jgi:NTE family protein
MMATTDEFASAPTVRTAVQNAKTPCADRKILDLIDDGGPQYVDFVMEGGAVLGIAPTGCSYVLEQGGIRFFGIGGTSAGSINALTIEGGTCSSSTAFSLCM